jgi:hypothetical protein
MTIDLACGILFPSVFDLYSSERYFLSVFSFSGRAANTMEKSMGSLSLTDRKLVIGIDFGTTFTGVAWAETRRVRLTSSLFVCQYPAAN